MGRRKLLRSYSSLTICALKICDLALVGIAGLLSYYLLLGSLPHAPLPKTHIMMSLVLYSVVADRCGLYSAWRGKSLSAELIIVAVVGCILLLTLGVAGELVETQSRNESNANWLAHWFTAVVMAQCVLRLVVRPMLAALRTRGFNRKRILFVGCGANAAAVLNEIIAHPEYGLQVVGYLDDKATSNDSQLKDIPLCGRTDDILKICQDLSVSQIWINYALREERRTKRLLAKLQHSTTSVRYVFDLKVFNASHQSITGLSDFLLLDIYVSPMDGTVSRLAKEIEDRVLASLMLLILSPLFIIIAIGVKLSSPGPVLYKQTRVGWNSKPFKILKFRSMPVDAEKESGPKWASSLEHRATPIGALLRSTSADELPQFINVLKGEMSIVGPRPERPEFVHKFKDTIPDYMKKHMVKAGITGWAQVNGFRGDTDLAQRVKHDLYYIKHWTPLFDLQIAYQTIYKGLVHKNSS